MKTIFSAIALAIALFPFSNTFVASCSDIVSEELASVQKRLTLLNAVGIPAGAVIGILAPMSLALTAPSSEAEMWT